MSPLRRALAFFAAVATLALLVFAGGHDVESGPPEKVFANPQHPTTQAFLKRAGKD